MPSLIKRFQNMSNKIQVNQVVGCASDRSKPQKSTFTKLVMQEANAKINMLQEVKIHINYHSDLDLTMVVQ